MKATDYHLSGGMHSQLVNSPPNSELVNPEKQSSCYSRLYNPSPNSGIATVRDALIISNLGLLGENMETQE